MPKFHGQPLIPSYAMRMTYDANGRQDYVGFAMPGTKTSEAKWTIYRMSYDASSRMIVRSYADGKDSLDKVWDNKSDYDYLDI